MLLSDLETNPFQSKSCEIIHHEYCGAATFCFFFEPHHLQEQKNINKNKTSSTFSTLSKWVRRTMSYASLHLGKHSKVKHRSNLHAFVLFVAYLAHKYFQCSLDPILTKQTKKRNETMETV